MEPRPENERRSENRIETEPSYTSPFTITGRVRSFRHALSGLGFVLRSQHNAWLHALATALVLGIGGALHWTGIRDFTPGEWCALAVAITIVWVAEAFNTGLEVLADAVMSERHPVVKIAKDVAAGAVLVAAFGAVIVGAILFAAPLVELFRRWFA